MRVDPHWGQTTVSGDLYRYLRYPFTLPVAAARATIAEPIAALPPTRSTRASCIPGRTASRSTRGTVTTPTSRSRISGGADLLLRPLPADADRRGVCVYAAPRRLVQRHFSAGAGLADGHDRARAEAGSARLHEQLLRGNPLRGRCREGHLLDGMGLDVLQEGDNRDRHALRCSRASAGRLGQLPDRVRQRGMEAERHLRPDEHPGPSRCKRERVLVERRPARVDDNGAEADNEPRHGMANAPGRRSRSAGLRSRRHVRLDRRPAGRRRELLRRRLSIRRVLQLRHGGEQRAA